MNVTHRMKVAVAAAGVVALPFVFGASAANSAPGDKPAGNSASSTAAQAAAAAMYTDEINDYGVCRGLDPSCYNVWGNGYTEGEEKRVLIYSGTAGPRHAHLGAALGPGLNPPLGPDNVAQQNLVNWLAEAGIKADWTEDLAGSRARLTNYQAFINLSGNRDTFDDTEQTTLLQYVRGGGGFVGIHNAFGAEYHWEWYNGLLGGANFYDHEPNRAGTVETITQNDVSTAGLPDEWEFTDEWYNLQPYPSFVKVLLEVDAETSLQNTRGGHPGHGEEHAVSWCHYYDGGRSWLTTLGHDVAAWTDAELVGDTHFKQHVVSGIESAMGVKQFCA
jgi:type 1 glutamine amidotransferase